METIPKTYADMFKILVTSENVEALCFQWLGNKDNVLEFKKQLRNQLIAKKTIISPFRSDTVAQGLHTFLYLAVRTRNSIIPLKQSKSFCNWLFRHKKVYY